MCRVLNSFAGHLPLQSGMAHDFFLLFSFFSGRLFFLKYVTPNRPHQAPAASVQYGPSALERE